MIKIKEFENTWPDAMIDRDTARQRAEYVVSKMGVSGFHNAGPFFRTMMIRAECWDMLKSADGVGVHSAKVFATEHAFAASVYDAAGISYEIDEDGRVCETS